MELAYRLIDADNHYYEPYDAFTRHIEERYRERAVHVITGDDGRGRLYFGKDRLSFMRVIQTDYMGAPGSSRAFFDGVEGDTWDQKEIINAHDHPPMMRRDARLALMDEQGVEACILLPTVAVAVEYELQKDVDAYYANLRAFNRWIEEDWGYGSDGRIFSTALASLVDLERGTAELERVLARGAKVIHIKPGPAGRRSPADTYFDPFWARVEEAGVLVVFHTGHSGYNELVSTIWGEPALPAIQHISPFQWFLGFDERPIADTLANLVLFNLFGRFPGLRVASIENGSRWVGPTCESMDHAVRLARRGRWPGGRFDDLPSDVFRNNVWVAPHPEEDVLGLADLIGADHVLFGSDYPHSEGLAEPADFAKRVESAGAEVTRKIMRDNAAALLGLNTPPG